MHDELVFEVPREYADDFCAFLKIEMEHIDKFSIPFRVDTAIGNNWQEAK